MIKQYWRVVLFSFASGVIGIALTLAAIHLWDDHAQFHQAINWIISVQKSAQQGSK